MSEAENVAAVRGFIERVWNHGDEAAFDEHISPDFVGGPDRFKAMIVGFREAFPDLTMEVHDIFGSGDKVVTRWTLRGTHQADFQGIAATGRRIEMGGIAIDRLHEGVRVEGWAQYDRLGLLAQLGAVDYP